MTSLVGCPQFLGHASVGQDYLFAINFTVVSFLVDSLTAHLSCREEAFLVAVLSAYQST